MQQSRASNQGGYRIKKQKNNFLGDPYSKDDEDYFKMSIHSSTNKSPGKGSDHKKRNNSLANRHNESEKFSYRSRNSNLTKGNLSSSSLSGSNKKKDDQTGQIKQFANVKQLLMIKAYDKKLFRKVTGSNEANKNFLRLGDVRNDPFRKETFKVMIQNFKQITIRIRKGYEKVLSKILFQNTNTSAIVTLANVQPLLEKVRQEADLMHYKVKECLQAHDSRQFRSLLVKFQTFLTASEQIQEIILIVSESKNKIDDLFKNLQRDNHIDDKVNHERRKGLKKVRNAVRDYGDDCVQAKILDKVQLAINEMADKTLQAYSKINGARGLMMRIKQCLKQNKDFYSLQDIVKFNKIFKEVLTEAESYERFTQKFMEEGDIVNDDLRQCILRYKEEVETNKAAVYAMELKFVSNIIETSIQTFEANYSVCNAVDSTMCEDFEKVTNLLDSICGCISDETVKVAIKAMSRDVGHHFKNLEKQVKRLQRIPKSISLDTQTGLQNLIKIQNLIDEYKKNLRQIMDREDRAHRQITKKRVSRQNIEDSDLQQNSIRQMIRISKKLNDDERKERIFKCKAFQKVRQDDNILQLAAEIGDFKFYSEFKNLQAEIQQLCHNNQLSTLIQDITTQNTVYELSPLFVELHQIASSVTQYNLLKNLESLNSKGFSKLKQVDMVQCFLERVYALVAIKGLDKKIIKRIDNNRQIQFPENQHDVETLKRDVKYLKTVSSLMPEVVVKEKINLAFIAMEQLIQGIKITQDLKWNKDGLYYLENSAIFKVVEQAFQRVFRFKEKVDLDEILKNLKAIGHNLDKITKKQKNGGYNQTRTQKVLQIIKKYDLINQKMIENMQKIDKLQIFEGYAQLVHICCQYLKSTLQSFYATLNKTSHVLWICQEPKQNTKSPFGISIGLSKLKLGEMVKTYNQKSSIKSRKQVPKPKVEVKQQKKKIKQDNQMGEQIEEDEQVDEIADGIDDQIQDQQMQQDMQQEMEEDMDQMDEEMQDEIPNEESMDEEMIVEADENIIDDFESEGIVKKNNTRPSAAKNKDHTINTTNKPETTLNNSNPAKNSIEPIIKKQESEIIFIKEKKASILLQIFKYIQTLEDLAQLLKKIDNLRLNFWHSVDLKMIENYFNKEGNSQLEKVLAQQLQKYCKAQFDGDFISSIKDSQAHKIILKQIDELSLLKFAILCQILTFAGKNYGCLMGMNKELLRLSIQDNDKWHPSACVEAFVNKQLVLAEIKEDDFDKINYTEQLLKTKKGKQIRYEFGDKNLQLKGEELKEKVKQCEKIIKQYDDYSKFPDGINLQELIVKMWFNSIKDDELVEIKVTDKFHQDLKKLSIMENFAHGIYYHKKLREEAKKVMEHMEKHQKKLSKIFKHLNRDTLLDSIAQLIKIYNCEASKVVWFQDHPIMYRQPSGQLQQKFIIIKKVLIPENASSNKLNGEQMRNRIKQSPQQYAEFCPEINRILSLLQIQCHIWPSPTVLHIAENRDDLLKIIIGHISNELIKDPYEQLENLQQINSCLKSINKQNLIFEYAIKEDSKSMNPQSNASFYRQFTKVMDGYSKKVQNKLQVADTVFENLFGFEDTQDSVTTQVFDYTQTISLILKQKLFAEKWDTIFNFHIPTQNKIQELKKKIDSQVRLLLAIVEDPIEVNIAEPLKSLEEVNKKCDLVARWYKQHKSKEKNNLVGLQICPCVGSCEKQYTLYVGQNKNRAEQYIKKLSGSPLLSEYVKKNEKKSMKSEWKQSTTIHLGEMTKQICSQLIQTDVDLFRDFIRQYNLVHIIRKETNNKNLADIYQKLVKMNSKKLDLAKMVSQVMIKIKQNASLFKLLGGVIHESCGQELAQIMKNNEQEKAKLGEVAVGKTQYTTFGNWVVHIAGKIYKLPFYILMDMENQNDVVCIMTGKTDDEVKKELKNLQLPTEFTLIQEKHSYKKIHLNQQYFTIKLDENELTKQDLFDIRQQNFGIQEVEREGNHKQTWLLGVYRKSSIDSQQDEFQLLMATITEKLLAESKKVQVNINQFEIKADIQLRILEISFVEGGNINSNNIIREIKSETFKGVTLNQEIVATALSRFLKTQLTNIKQKKKAQLRQKLLKEQREKEQQEQRLRAATKAKEEQEKKERERLQKQKQAEFILQHPEQRSVSRQEADAYLDKLYEQLVSKKIYTASKQKLKGSIESKQNFQKPKSSKNIEIKTETEKAIQKVQLSLEEDAKNQFHKIAETYLNCIVEFICYRDKILEQILQKAKSPDVIKPGEEGDEMEYMSNLMQEISSLQGYEPGLRDRVTQILRTLSKQKKQILTSIYQVPN